MFSYSLESVLDHKRRIEDIHRKTLAALEEKRLIQCQAAEDLRSALDKCGLVPDNGWDYQNLVNYWEQLLGQIEACNMQIARLEQEVQTQRSKVVAAAVDRRKLEVHREKKQLQYSQSQLRKEQVQLDEMGSRVYLTQKGGEECR